MMQKNLIILIALVGTACFAHSMSIEEIKDGELIEPGTPIVTGKVESDPNEIHIEELGDDYEIAPGTPTSQGIVEEPADDQDWEHVLDSSVEQNPAALSFVRPEVMQADVCLKQFEGYLGQYVEAPKSLTEIRDHLYEQMPSARAIEEIIFRPNEIPDYLIATDLNLVEDCKEYLYGVEQLKQQVDCLHIEPDQAISDVTSIALSKIDYAFGLDQFLGLKKYHDIRAICGNTLFPHPQQ